MHEYATAQLRRFRLGENTPAETVDLTGSSEDLAIMLVSAFAEGLDDRFTVAFRASMSHQDQQFLTNSVLAALTAAPPTRGRLSWQDEPLYYPGPRVRVSGPDRPRFVLRDELGEHVLGLFLDHWTFVLSVLPRYGPGVDWLSLSSERLPPDGRCQENRFGELVPGLFYEHHLIGVLAISESRVSGSAKVAVRG